MGSLKDTAAGARECDDESEPTDDPHGLGHDGALPIGGAELSLAMLKGATKAKLINHEIRLTRVETVIWIARPDGFDVAGGGARTSR